MAVGFNELLGDGALVDEAGPHLEIGLARHDFDVPLPGHGVLELFLAFACLKGAELGIGASVMPCQSDAFAFDEGAYPGNCFRSVYVSGVLTTGKNVA
jgi:hypothetical protein